MGTLEKSSKDHEFSTLRRRFAKNRDFRVRNASDHVKETIWSRSRKIIDFDPKMVRGGPKYDKKVSKTMILRDFCWVPIDENPRIGRFAPKLAPLFVQSES